METTTPAADADQSARDRLAHSLQEMVEEAEHLLENAQRTGSDQFTAARDKFESQLRRAKAELSRLEESAIYNAKRAARATDQAVHEHPYTAMGISAGLGLLIGMLIARR
ncbi:MAG: DUF883 domain-containing protein [Burkholderiaceae bacterium]